MLRLQLIRWSSSSLLAAFLLLGSCLAHANSVLTHEQIVDFLWKSDIEPILLAKFANTTPDQLRIAHGYAYGGCLIHDLGYYPGGNKFFSDLAHYVRTGTFVSELVSEASDVNELAFAIGALAHYAADTTAHPAVNSAVALVFPRLRAKYGDQVTYEDDPKAHIRTEFGFDVSQVAQQHYSSEAYHDFIGFQVSRDLLDRAFLKTYGFPLKDIFSDEDLTISNYRRAVSIWIPRLTKLALIVKKDELRATPNFNPKKFRYLLSRTQYEKEWGKNYVRPWFMARFFAFLIRLLPKVGPLRTLDIKAPTRQTEKIYVKSVEETVDAYHKILSQIGGQPLTTADLDLDTGKPSSPGEYRLADRAYAHLLKQLVHDNVSQITPALRANILEYYSDLNRPIETRQHKDEWQELLHNLETLKQQPSAPPGAF